MTTKMFGEPIPRREDPGLLRGQGRYLDDLGHDALAAAFVRSPHAHARVVSVKADDARRAKKVLAVLIAADMKAANVGSVSRHPPVPGRGGAKMIMPFRPSLAGEKVMHVGDPVAMVVCPVRWTRCPMCSVPDKPDGRAGFPSRNGIDHMRRHSTDNGHFSCVIRFVWFIRQAERKPRTSWREYSVHRSARDRRPRRVTARHDKGWSTAWHPSSTVAR